MGIAHPATVKLLAAAAIALGLTGASAAPTTLGGCPVFPASNPWNRAVDQLPVASDSDTIIRSIGVDAGVHADFGSGLYDGSRIGIPYVVVHGKRTPKSRVSFDYADESDKGPYPIPAGVPIEGAPAHANEGDRHALIVDRDSCKLYELYALHRGGGRWQAGSGSIWNLRSNALRPAGWTSADAAGLPILPASPAGTATRRPAGSTTRCVSRPRAPAARSSIPRVTTRATRTTRRCRRWDCACG
jgi:hypothetical protein